MSAGSGRAFRHVLLRDAAVQLQLPRERARLHRLAFGALEDLFGGRAPEPAASLPQQDASPPHPTDKVAAEPAQHALLASPDSSDPDAWGTLHARYLARAAEHAEQLYGQGQGRLGQAG
jgi:hypothetical protein